MSDQENVREREHDEQTQQPRSFNPNEHLIQLKSSQGAKDYLPVQWRLVWFRTICPQGMIETEMLHLDLDRDTEEETFVWSQEKRRSEKVIKHANGFVIFKATVKDGKGGIATGTKSEKAASFPDFIEKAETGAIGRALAALGYGTQFAPELDEAHRIVDSPVERYPASVNGNGNSGNGSAPLAPVRVQGQPQGSNNGSASAAEPSASALATEQQLSSIRKLREHLGKDGAEEQGTLSYLNAKKLIQQLTAEYREQKQQNKAS